MSPGNRRLNVAVSIQYDGSNFNGYELQPGKRTVRGEAEKALFKIFKKKTKIYASSRTDSGVHAVANVINFTITNKIPISKIPKALNSVLPQDLRVVSAKEVGTKFNSRFSVKAKEYEYLIYNGEILNPLFRNFVWHVKPKINLIAMKKAAKKLIGTHDFSAFCASGSASKDYICTIYNISIRKRYINIWDGCKLEVVSCKLTGNRFLYKMVRNIVGNLVGPAKRCAPPQGLCLVKTNH